MIQEIRIKNYKCFKDEVTLSFEAVEEDTFQLDRQTVKVAENVHLLRFAAIYGANASGKSTVLEVMELLYLLFNTNPQQNQRWDVVPYAFDEKSLTEPTEIEIVYWYGKQGTFYKCSYKIVLNSSAILYEELHFGDYLLFKRVTDSDTKNTIVNIYPYAQYKFSDIAVNVISYTCTHNRSVVSIGNTINCMNDDESTYKFVFTSVSEYFVSYNDVSRPKFVGFTYDSSKRHVLDLLSKTGFDIVDITDKKSDEGKKYFFKHQAVVDGEKKEIYLDSKYESTGTLSFLNIAESVVGSDYLLTDLDEPDNSIHTSLFIKLIDWFLDNRYFDGLEIDRQLLITTHNTELLDSVNHIIRADSIWFVNKDKQTGASEMYSLVDFGGLNKIRLFSKAYLAGCFDALPDIEDSVYDREDENSVDVMELG